MADGLSIGSVFVFPDEMYADLVVGRTRRQLVPVLLSRTHL